MNPREGRIFRCRHMAIEYANAQDKPGTKLWWRAYNAKFMQLMREQLSFDDYRGRTRRNPSPPPSPTGHNPADIDPDPYRAFHGVDPSQVEERKTWVPGELVLLGSAVDVGYRAKDRHSNKGRGPYVHDFGGGVRAFRRARKSEHVDKVWRNFPTNLTVLGQALGFTYQDANGRTREVKLGKTKRLSTTPSRRVLVVVGSKGVEYVIEGGNMHVADWIRD